MRAAATAAVVLALAFAGQVQADTGPQIATALSLGASIFKIRSAMPQQVEVTTTGTGETRETAITNANIAAVKQALSTIIISRQTVADDELVANTVIERTAGVVNSFEVVKCSQAQLWVCQIRAKVSTELAVQALQAENAKVIKVNGEQLMGQQATYRHRAESGRDLVSDLFAQYEDSGLHVTLKVVTPTPTGSRSVMMLAKVQVDNSQWYAQMKHALMTMEVDRGDARAAVYYKGQGDWFGCPCAIKIADATVPELILGYHDYRPSIEYRVVDYAGFTLASACMADRDASPTYLHEGSGWAIVREVKFEKMVQINVPERVVSQVAGIEAHAGCSGPSSQGMTVTTSR